VLFPPAFLPLFEHWDCGYGYWKHWTTGGRMTMVRHRSVRTIARDLSIVEMFTNPDPSRAYELLVTEVACNLEQLFRIHLLDWLCNGPGEWTDELRCFASRAGMSEDDVNWIERSSTTNYRPCAFLGHPLFLNQQPISSLPGPPQTLCGRSNNSAARRRIRPSICSSKLIPP
jgi:hypothetical protein